MVFDRMQRAFPLERASSPAVIVAIDEESLRRYGQWPWPRARMAGLLERIDAMHPAAIALDMFFPEPDRYSPGAIARELELPPPVARLIEAIASSDARFAEAMRDRRVVLGVAASAEIDPRFAGAPRAAPVVVAPGADRDLDDYRGHIASIPMLDAAASGHGLMNSGAADQVIRRVPIVARVQGAIVPTLAVEALRVANDAGLSLARGAWGTIEMRLAGARFPLQEDGTAWLRFAPHDPGRFVSAADVLDGKADPARFRSRLVLVGFDAVGLQDYRTTPLGDVVPGVEVHAQVAENVFDGVSLVRPGWARIVEVAILLAAAIGIVVAVPRLTALQGLNAVLLLVVLIAGSSLLAFVRMGLLVDPAWPSIGVIAVYVTVVVGSLSEAERQRRLLREQAARLAGEMDAARRI